MPTAKQIIIFLVFLAVIFAIFTFSKKQTEVLRSQETRQYEDAEYGISFSYPAEWGEVEVIPGNSICPEEDTYRTPDTLSIFDKELRFKDRDLEDSESIIRSGVRIYRMNPIQSNNCNDEVLRQLATKKITGETFSSFRLTPAGIPGFYGVHNEAASRLDTESREQYTLFVEESGSSILVIQPYMSFIPFADSPEWLEIDSKFQGDILSYVKKGETAQYLRDFLADFRTTAGSIRSKQSMEIQTVASDLDTPWEIVVLPDGTLMTTERSGTLHILGADEKEIQVPGVSEAGEGGHLGAALHPEFGSNRFLYLYFTTRQQGTASNKVVRYVFDGVSLDEPKTIIDGIPASTVHNGGRMAFGPDGMLYITTGDAGSERAAQNTGSLAGKILRLRDDGSIPTDNPFGNPVYSYGHRNPQGLAWDEEGGLWATEHGRSGVQSGYDEINYIERGANYGWPDIQGSETREGMKAPAVHSGASTTWAPAGLVYKEGKLYFAGLRGQALYEVPIISSGTLGEITGHYKNQFGRLRAVAVDGGGEFLVSTSNRDGRGDPNEDDDRILRIRLP